MYEQIRAIALVLTFWGLYPVPAAAGTVSGTGYQLTTIAGSDMVGDGGAAVAAQVDQPEGLAVDSAGNLYISDAANHRVRKVGSDGTITTVAGTGHPGFGGDAGPATAAQLNQPYGLAVDKAGNLYVADFGNQRVRRVGTDGTMTTVAGNGETGSDGDGGPATAAQMLSPRNLAIDPGGNIYISEFMGHTVRRVGTDGIITTIAGTGIAGFSGDGGPAASAQLAFPAGLALDSAGALYIADTVNFSIRKVLAGTITTVCNQQNFGVPNTQLSGIAADSTGRLYIPEGVNSVVWVLSSTGTLTLAAGIPGSSSPSGDGGLALQTALIRPVDVAVDSAGDLYISELQRVRSVAATTGVISTVAGDGTFGFSGDGGSATAAMLDAPLGLAVLNGNVFVADQANQRVREVSAAGVISTVAGNGMAAYAGDGLAATSASLFNPAALTFDANGNLYVADSYSNRVRMIGSSGVVITFAGNGSTNGFGGEGNPAVFTPLFHPQGVLADTSGDVYVADSNHNRVIRIDPAANMHTVAGTWSWGDDTSSVPQLQGPTGLALDSAGNLYIADHFGLHRVRMVTAAGTISTIAGTGTSGFHRRWRARSVCRPQLSLRGGGGFQPKHLHRRWRQQSCPHGDAGRQHSDDRRHRRRRIYRGQWRRSPSRSSVIPRGLALDGSGNLLVADTGNNRVRMLATSQVTVTPPADVDATFTNAASLLPGPLAPGEIFTIFGQGIGPATGPIGAFDTSGVLATTLGGTWALFDQTAAPLFYAQAQQINAQVPYEVAGQASAQVQIIYNGTTVATQQVPLAAASPALFTTGSGMGQVVAVNEDGSINSDQHPAQLGSVVVFYATGQGQTQPASTTGQAAQAPFGMSLLPVSLTIGGIPADIIWEGSAPGFVGLDGMINARIPSGFIPTGNLPVILTIGTYGSAASTTIAIQ